MFKLAVSGSRRISDADFVFTKLDEVLSRRAPLVEILHGASPLGGVDGLAAEYAVARDYAERPFPPRAYGREALLARNIAMVEAADALVAFPDQDSRGTRHAISAAVSRGLPVVVFDCVAFGDGRVVSHKLVMYNRSRT